VGSNSSSRVARQLGTSPRGFTVAGYRSFGLKGKFMIIHVTQVKVVGSHSLELEFDNGVHKRVNLRKEFYGKVFEPLRDPAYFAQVFIDPDSRTITWPNRADFAPDFLFQMEPENETSYA